MKDEVICGMTSASFMHMTLIRDSIFGLAGSCPGKHLRAQSRVENMNAHVVQVSISKHTVEQNNTFSFVALFSRVSKAVGALP